MTQNRDLPFKTAIFTKLLQEAQKLLSQTNTRMLILRQVTENPLTVAQIARVLGRKRQSIQSLADQFVHEKICIYKNNIFHSRAKLLTLTQKGHKMAVQEAKDFEIVVQRLSRDISVEKLCELTRALELMNQ